MALVFEVRPIDAAYGLAVEQDNLMDAGGVVCAVVDLLGRELHANESVTLRRAPAGQVKLGLAHRAIKAREKFVVLRRRLAQSNLGRIAGHCVLLRAAHRPMRLKRASYSMPFWLRPTGIRKMPNVPNWACSS